jgi:hypothetical protein
MPSRSLYCSVLPCCLLLFHAFFKLLFITLKTSSLLHAFDHLAMVQSTWRAALNAFFSDIGTMFVRDLPYMPFANISLEAGGFTGRAQLRVGHDMADAFDVDWDGGGHESKLGKVRSPNNEVLLGSARKEIVRDRWAGPGLNWCVPLLRYLTAVHQHSGLLK